MSIGDRTLATYSYTNDRNHYLSALDYGNEDSVNYTYDGKGRVTDEQARVLIRKITKCGNALEFQELDIAVRDKCLKKLREKGVSIRQLSRLTGISYGVVRKF